MARLHDRQTSVVLRLQGKTYSEIRKEVNVAKSTLSEWLRNYPLTNEQIAALEKNRIHNKQVGAEKTRNIKLEKRKKRLQKIYEEESQKWRSLTQRELLLAGIFLYWGEGNKSLKGSLSLNNCDPKVLQFALTWLLKGLNIPKEKIKIYLHLYSDMDSEKEIDFWSRTLSLPRSQFMKPYIKASKRIDITHKGFGHGTCALIVNDVRIKERIMMAINAIADASVVRL